MKKLLLLSVLLVFALSSACVGHHRHHNRDYNDSYRSSDQYRGSHQDSSYHRSSRSQGNRGRSYND